MSAAEKQVARSIRPDIRNPLLQLPSMQAMRNLPPGSRAALRALLRDIAADARERADKSWRKHKAPMAVYWKVVAVYAGHTARALR